MILSTYQNRSATDAKSSNEDATYHGILTKNCDFELKNGSEFCLQGFIARSDQERFEHTTNHPNQSLVGLGAPAIRALSSLRHSPRCRRPVLPTRSDCDTMPAGLGGG